MSGLEKAVGLGINKATAKAEPPSLRVSLLYLTRVEVQINYCS